MIKWLTSILLIALFPLSARAEVIDFRQEYHSVKDADRTKMISRSLDRVEASSTQKSEAPLPARKEYPSFPLREQNGFVSEVLDNERNVLDSLNREKKKEERQPPGTDFPGREKIISKELDKFTCEVNVSAGVRKDDLQWSIGGIDGSPNILSELTWSDVYSTQMSTRGKIVWDKTIRLDGAIDYGWIVNGDNQDSDYDGNNRTLESSRSNNATDNDNVWDSSIGLGYQFHVPTSGGWEDFLTEDLWIVFLGGYSYHEQNFRITSGNQTIPATGHFDSLNSTYQTEWKGPWLGFEAFGHRKNFKGFTRLEYHWADYHAEADWNLRTDFAHPVSFEQDADGTGVVFSLGGELLVNDQWSVGVKTKIQNWETKHGRNQFNLADGSTQALQPFNGAEWKSFAVMLSATYLFPDRAKKEILPKEAFLKLDD